MKKKDLPYGIKIAIVALMPLLLAGCHGTKAPGKAVQQELNNVSVTLSDEGCEADGSGVKLDGSTVTITKSGNYILRGVLSDGQIVVDADLARVRLTLGGVSVENAASACIYVKRAAGVSVVTEASSQNHLRSLDFKESKDVDAVIFSKSNLYFEGEGSLEIDGQRGHGIAAKDSLSVTGQGTYDIHAKKDALQVNDEILIDRGTFFMQAGKDAVHCDEGAVLIKDGTFRLAAGDDAIHAAGEVRVEGGEISITQSHEGIEGADVRLLDGRIYVSAQDDGINATGRKGALAELQIAGGSLEVNAGGDGVDANGALIVSGGRTRISGSIDGTNGAIDYDTEAVITGGTIVAAGFIDEAKGFEQDSPQPSWSVRLKKVHREKIELCNEAGEKLYSYKPCDRFQSVVISVPEMQFGETYILKVGTEVCKKKM